MTTWMDVQGIILSEVSQTEKDKYCVNLKKHKNKIQKNPKLTDLENRLLVARGRGGGGRGRV